MEMGKDILAIAPDGIPCAYQLKAVEGGGRITLSQWRDDLSKQLHPLVNRQIVHPSIPAQGQPHRSYIVINGELDEEVARDVDDFNRLNVVPGAPERKVEVIVKGQLFKAFKDLQTDFWVSNLGDLKTYLELFLEDGRGQLPKDKISRLIESALPFSAVDRAPPSRSQLVRSVAGCAITCASAISAFTIARNHLAEFEAWTMYWAYTVALVEKWSLPPKHVEFALGLASDAMYSSLGRLCDELMERDEYMEPDVISDWFVYGVRITQLLALMGIYGLWRAQRIRDHQEQADNDRDAFLRRFCHEKAKFLLVWGEYAIPQWLAFSFYYRTINATPESDFLYARIIEMIVRANGPHGAGTLANPYYDAESILPRAFGLDPEPLEDSFLRSSFMLEGVMHLFVRANYKRRMKYMFPDLTQIQLRAFVPDELWESYRYRSPNGKNVTKSMRPPHRWSELRTTACECAGSELPAQLKHYPFHYLSLICVYPHRFSASGIRWLSTRLEQTV
jgi:hypothetical protein